MTPTVALPLLGMQAGFRRFSVVEYHQLTELGILTEDDNLELIEGYLIHKIAHNPPHDGTLSRVLKRLLQLLPPGWDFRSQMALTLPDSEPEPDLVIVRESPDGYLSRHPAPRKRVWSSKCPTPRWREIAWTRGACTPRGNPNLLDRQHS